MADFSTATMSSDSGLGTAGQSIAEVVNTHKICPANDVIIADLSSVDSRYWPEIVEEIRQEWADVKAINSAVVEAGGILQNIAGTTVDDLAKRFTPAEVAVESPYQAQEASTQRGDWSIYERSSVADKDLEQLISGEDSAGSSTVS
jgi:hypothetical protein